MHFTGLASVVRLTAGSFHNLDGAAFIVAFNIDVCVADKVLKCSYSCVKIAVS